MYKNIYKSILAAALVALVLTSCTDEADVLDNKPIKNIKTIEENLRPYPEFEEINIEAEDVISLLSGFNQAMNDEISMPDMQIDTALLLMETYFNYGVVDKQSEYDTKISYSDTIFAFTIQLDSNENINGDILSKDYNAFLTNVKSLMGYKYLQYSDLFVSEISESSITFGLAIPPFDPNLFVNGRLTHKRLLKDVSDPLINIPDSYSITWYNHSTQHAIYIDYTLAGLCLKTTDGFYFSIRLVANRIGNKPYMQAEDVETGDIILDSYNLTYEIVPAFIATANNIINNPLCNQINRMLPDEKVMNMTIRILYTQDDLEHFVAISKITDFYCARLNTDANLALLNNIIFI